MEGRRATAGRVAPAIAVTAGPPDLSASARRDLLAIGGLRMLDAVSRHLQRGFVGTVDGGRLRAMGAYGTTSRGERLAAATREFSAALNPELGTYLAAGRPLVGRCETFGLGNLLFLLIGKPVCDTAVVLPVGVGGQPGFVYADNGGRSGFVKDPLAFWRDVRTAYLKFAAELGEVFLPGAKS